MEVKNSLATYISKKFHIDKLFHHKENSVTNADKDVKPLAKDNVSVTPPKADELGPKIYFNVLNKEQTDSAILFANKTLPVPVIEKLQKLLELKVTGVPDENFVNGIATVQKENALTADGKPGSQSMKIFIQKGLDSTGLDGQYPRYDELFKDGLIDTTVGFGYDEGGSSGIESNAMELGLKARGFREISSPKAAEIYKQTNRDFPTSNADVKFFYKEGVTSYAGKPVNSIVQIINAPKDGNNGRDASQTFKNGMNESEFAIYSGHGRYGTGPDFDKNFTTTIKFMDGTSKSYDNYEVLESELKKNENLLKKLFGEDPEMLTSIKKMSSTDILKKINKDGKLKVEGANAGNIVVNSRSPHNYEFGGYLTELALKSSDNANISDSVKDDKYRVWLFNGCRTKDYVSGIRNAGKLNKELGKEKLDLFVTTEVTPWSSNPNNSLSYLDGLIAKESFEEIKNRVAKNNPQLPKNALRVDGAEENPSFKLPQ